MPVVKSNFMRMESQKVKVAPYFQNVQSGLAICRTVNRGTLIG